ncbi:MAG: hypothetical protein JWM36_1011 [Hyphomicrobiales bacterium]|nr:hypothetical protein [Hyphomicrobiales bacterium]
MKLLFNAVTTLVLLLPLTAQAQSAQQKGQDPQPNNALQMNKSAKPSDPAWKEDPQLHSGGKTDTSAEKKAPLSELGSKMPTSSSPDSSDNQRTTSTDGTKR